MFLNYQVINVTCLRLLNAIVASFQQVTGELFASISVNFVKRPCLVFMAIGGHKEKH